MSAYFDDLGQEIEDAPDAETLADIEDRLVRDVDAVCACPAIPRGLRDAMHRAILAGAVSNGFPGTPGYETADTTEAQRSFLRTMAGDLHSLFHVIARTVPGFVDSPDVGDGGVGDAYRRALLLGELEPLLKQRQRIEDALAVASPEALTTVWGSLFSGEWEDYPRTAAEVRSGVLFWAGLDVPSFERVAKALREVGIDAGIG